MSEITIRPMVPEDWDDVARIYLEALPPSTPPSRPTVRPMLRGTASHTKECRLVILANGVLAGWAALHRVDPRWCYRGVAEVSIYVGERFRGKGLGSQLLNALCADAEKAGYWTCSPPCCRTTRPAAPAY